MQKKSLKSSFFTSIRWNIIGSIIYESLKLIHQIALFKVLNIALYGIIGILFSCIYLTIHLADFESATSLLPYISSLKKSRQRIKSFFSFYLLTNVLILLLGSLIALIVLTSFFNFQRLPIHPFIIISLVVSEGLRIFLRIFLHSVFISKQTSIIDLLVTIGYFTAVWIPYLFFSNPITPSGIFIPYFIASLGAISGFSYLIWEWYISLPSIPHDNIEAEMPYQLAKTRFFNYLCHVSKYFFTGNFLTPLFAVKFGLEQAGFLKFASYLSDGIKALINVSIGYSGSALLAQLKSHSLTIKRHAFSALWKTFNTIIYPLLIFITINYQVLYVLWLGGKESLIALTQPLIITCAILLFISLIENFFLAYEEFYLIEEQSGKLLLIKLYELITFLTLLSVSGKTPYVILLIAISVRLGTFIALASNAYAKWRIKPALSVPLRYIIIPLCFSCLFLLTFKYFYKPYPQMTNMVIQPTSQ